MSREQGLLAEEVEAGAAVHLSFDHFPVTQAATEADIDTTGSNSCAPVRIVRHRIDDPAAFPPDLLPALIAKVHRQITACRHLNPVRPDRSYPRVVKCARHNSYRVKQPTDIGVRHPGPPTIDLVNLRQIA